MAKIEQRPTITLEASFVLDEAEARALHALTEYGEAAFIKMAEPLLGERATTHHAKGLSSLFRALREHMPGIIRRTNEARWVFTGERIATAPPKETT